ncbi:MAG TPA: hypothetical protein VLH40_00550 [Atribacteraceae bacterium]|nr:hypothetical protein [Atribacteraceae bacterium]
MGNTILVLIGNYLFTHSLVSENTRFATEPPNPVAFYAVPEAFIEMIGVEVDLSDITSEAE